MCLEVVPAGGSKRAVGYGNRLSTTHSQWIENKYINFVLYPQILSEIINIVISIRRERQ